MRPLQPLRPCTRRGTSAYTCNIPCTGGTLHERGRGVTQCQMPPTAAAAPARQSHATPPPPVLTARVADSNAGLFWDAVRLYVPQGAEAVDATYGRGVLWQEVPSDYLRTLHRFDARWGTQLDALPLPDASVDLHVLDPPYMGGFFRRRHQTTAHPNHDLSARFGHSPTAGAVGAGEEVAGTEAGVAGAAPHAAAVAPADGRDADGGFRGYFEHEAVVALYAAGLVEAARVLRPGGVALVKVQDEVYNHRQYATHVEVLVAALNAGLVLEDTLVHVQARPPRARHQTAQAHARKNHSFLLVFRRPARPARQYMALALTPTLTATAATTTHRPPRPPAATKRPRATPSPA